MTLPTITGVVRVSARGTNVAGQQWVNVLHFQHGNPGTSFTNSDINALDTKLARLYSGTAYTTGVPWLTSCTSSTTLVDFTYYPLDGTSSPTVTPHAAAGVASNTTNQPSEIAHVLTLRTGIRGRRYRGRVYLPAVGTGSMSGTTGSLLAATVTNFLTQARGLLADLQTIQWYWAVVSYGHGTLNGAPQTWTPFSTPVTDVTMDAVADVQRRRKL